MTPLYLPITCKVLSGRIQMPVRRTKAVRMYVREGVRRACRYGVGAWVRGCVRCAGAWVPETMVYLQSPLLHLWLAQFSKYKDSVIERTGAYVHAARTRDVHAHMLSIIYTPEYQS